MLNNMLRRIVELDEGRCKHEPDNVVSINHICNYYGILVIKQEGELFYWGIHDWSIDEGEEGFWKEIPWSLARELLSMELKELEDGADEMLEESKAA